MVIGRAGGDTMYGGEGNDRMFGDGTNVGEDHEDGVGNDKMYGGTGNDYMVDVRGNDVLDGGDGNDSLICYWEPDINSPGKKTLLGGSGDDTLHGGTDW